MVLVSRKNKKTVLEYLFKEGVIAIQKDGFKEKHDDIDVPNLHCMMVMKSLASRDLVKMTFNWQWFYYILTDEGIEYLREALYLPAQVLPATLTKQARTQRTGGPDPEDDGEGRKGKGKGKGKGGGKGKKGGGWSSGKGGYGGGDEKPDWNFDGKAQES